MANNQTATYPKKSLKTEDQSLTQVHMNAYSLSDINSYFTSIPKYSEVTGADLTYTIEKVTQYGSDKSGAHGVDFSDTTDDVHTYASLPKGLRDIVSSTNITNDTPYSFNVSIKDYVINSKSSNAIQIAYTGANSIRIWHNYGYTFKSRIETSLTVKLTYNEPRAIVSVSKSGEGTVSGAGTYHWGSSYTITATPATGYHFVKWSDGNNTNASRKFTVNADFINNYKAYEAKPSYQAIFEKHSYTSTVTKQPTCTAKGVRTYTCSCGHSYTEEIPATGHNSNTVIPAVAATCTATGLTEGKKCSVCGTVTVAQTTVAKNPNNHSGSQVTIPAVAPTCTATGLTEGKKWSCCNAIITAQQTVAKLDHSYTSKVTAPTATSGGYTTYTCSCGHSYTADYTFLITANSNNANYGTVSGGDTYNQNATATLTATAKPGYKFVQWNDGNKNATRTVSVTASATYTATFEKGAFSRVLSS